MRTQTRWPLATRSGILRATNSRAATFSAGGTLSSRSRISASAPALTALSSMDSLLPGTKRNERTGFMTLTSTGFGQTELPLGDVRQDQLRADRRDIADIGFTHVT